MKCWVCGTTGGFANRLEIYLDDQRDGIVICEWCSADMRLKAMVATRD
jgi:hypothetical protein